MTAKTAAQHEAESLEDDDLPNTVQRADRARAEQRQAKEDLGRVEEKDSQIDQERKTLQESIQIVHDLLRSGARTQQPITVERLPEMTSFAFLQNVAEYREYRDDHAVSEPTTRTHRLGDILEQNQLHMATMATGGF